MADGAERRLAGLRAVMRERHIGALIVTKNDPHMSECGEDRWNGIRLISGFTGSAGTVVVTDTSAGLFVDGRYHLQASEEVPAGLMQVFKRGLAGVPDYMEFIKNETASYSKIGFDGRTMPVSDVKALQTALSGKHVEFLPDIDILAALASGEGREPRGHIIKPAFEHDTAFCGESREDKLARVMAAMRPDNGSEDIGAYVISSLDDIAWLFNLRGADNPFTPVFTAFAVIDGDGAALFADSRRLSGVAGRLGDAGVRLFPYDGVYAYVKRYNSDTAVALDPHKTSYALYKSIENGRVLERTPGIVEAMKAVKNAVELENLERTAVADGVSMVRLLMWVERYGGGGITECDVAQQAAEFRKDNPHFLCMSFETIAAFGPNAALPHYSPKRRPPAAISGDGLLLIDSGGNYLSGTTDITRTVAVGDIPRRMREDYTLVLKAHIALASCAFLYGASGSNIDAIARGPLWERGFNYGHGTGHGIGFCLNVHEGPQRIGMTDGGARLEAGMLVSNEPGLYRAGEYGIRLENTVCVAERGVTAFGCFMRFETVSYCPFDLNAVDAALLSADEKNWLNAYHARVFEKLAPFLNGDERAWLKNATRGI